MVQNNLKAVFAEYYPHLAPLADDLERILTIIQATNKGYGDVSFSSRGVDKDGHLEVKYIDSQLRHYRKEII
jgi:hypothetical protein